MGFDYGETKPDGQYERHPAGPADVPLIQEIRYRYTHISCNGLTKMPDHCAKQYAQNPAYYGTTFCCRCGNYFPVSEFIWPEDDKPINKPINEEN